MIPSLLRFMCPAAWLMLCTVAVAQPFPAADLLPKHETGSSQFVRQHPDYDGRGVVVAIFDTGVDPGAEGLQTTSNGKPKVIDMVDATGSGDVDMSASREVKGDTVEGLTGRTLKLNPAWLKTSRTVQLGLKSGYELFPASLVSQLKKRRSEAFQKQLRKKDLQLRDALAAAKSGDEKKEINARIAQLAVSAAKVTDPGPVFDCLMFRDGKQWWAVVDTDEDSDLRDETPLTTFRKNRGFATFAQAELNFAVNFYEDGKILSLVTDSGSHATHVAGIVAANYPKQPQRNGLAPGAQIVSVKIGDRRIVSMETAVALQRGLKAALDAKCDIVNMSYGEPSAAPNRGQLIEQIANAVNQHGLLFIASAGNDGPALSTAGSPGATSTPVLGIGAYLSPEMMQAAYAVRKKLPPAMYGFSSRGPAFDGDLGVDLIAPGGAVAPVPVWTRSRSMRMNGTSMAAPNATGAVALVVSAAKAAKVKYSPASIERALKNSALRVPGIDRFSQGAGLIQTGKAFEYLKANQAGAGELLPIQVDVGGSRGVYLRDAVHVRAAKTFRVQLRPQFPKNAPAAQRVQFELPLTVGCTADWVRAGSHVLMTSQGARFEIEVDPVSLPAGPHFAEVLLHDATNPQRGPVAVVPVSVIIPQEMKEQDAAGNACHQEVLQMAPSAAHRRFFAVPVWASWAEVGMKMLTDAQPQSISLHAVQCEPHDSFEQHQKHTYVRLTTGIEEKQRFDVLPGRTLETCFSQYFGALDETKVEISVKFHGARVEPSRAILPAGGTAEVAVVAGAQPLTLSPSARLTTRRQVLPPDAATVQLLPAGRDSTIDGYRRFELQLTYKFQRKAAGSVTPRWPREDGFLYESEFAGYLWNLYDAQGRRLVTDDSMPEAVRLKAGKYTLRLRVRHNDASKLEKLKKSVLWLDSPLRSAIKLQIAVSRLDAAAGRSAPRERLSPGGRRRLVISAPAAPVGVDPGDLLLGQLELQPGPDRKPGGYRIVYAVSGGPVAGASAGKSAPSNKPLSEQILQLKIEQLRHMSATAGKPAEMLLADILKESPGNLDVLTADLERLDTLADRKKHLAKVVAAADRVLSEIDAKALAAYYGVKHHDGNAAVQRQMARHRDVLINTLYRKGRAIGYMELPEVVAKHPITDKKQYDKAFEQNFSQLRQWVDTTGKDYVLLHIRWQRRNKKYGQALQLLNKLIDSSPVTFWYHKKRRDVFVSLGWEELAAYESNWMLIHFPQSYEKL